jgi:hypothetical protein
MIRQSYLKMYHWKSEHECGTCMMVFRAVRDVLNDTCHDRWIGRGGPTAWPPRSPDFNPLNICLWGHLKAIVYAAPVDNEVAPQIRTVDACQTIRNCPGIFARKRRSVMRRVEASIRSHGGHFERLLQMYCFGCNSQIKCVRTRVDTDMLSCFGTCNSCPKFIRSFQVRLLYCILSQVLHDFSSEVQVLFHRCR